MPANAVPSEAFPHRLGQLSKAIEGFAEESVYAASSGERWLMNSLKAFWKDSSSSTGSRPS